MNIGLTYDLREDYLQRGLDPEAAAEFDSVETIDAIDSALTSLGHESDRIGGILSLTSRLAAGDRWEIVFNIAEGQYGMGREAQVPALLDAFEIPYTFSDPLTLALTLHKGLCKSVVRELGVATPDFAVVERIEDVDAVRLPYPLFAKPVAEGSSKGIGRNSRVHNREELVAVCTDLLSRFSEPVLVETYLPGREFTVGMTGTGDAAEAVAVLEVLLVGNAEPEAYSYTNKQDYYTRVRYRLADDASAEAARKIALKAWRGLGCRDGGRVDVRCDVTGRPHFLEVNPLPGLHPVNSDLVILCGFRGINHAQLIGTILESALQRTPISTSGPSPTDLS